jgi:hypothetical protein
MLPTRGDKLEVWRAKTGSTRFKAEGGKDESKRRWIPGDENKCPLKKDTAGLRNETLLLEANRHVKRTEPHERKG